MEGAGEESIGSVEETGCLSSSRKSSSSDLPRLKTSIRPFSCNIFVLAFFLMTVQTLTSFTLIFFDELDANMKVLE